MKLAQNILITGGAGFIGHHIVEYLLKNTDHNIVSLDRIDTSCTLGRLSQILLENPEYRPRLKIVWHDLKSPINNHVAEEIGSIDYILHLAAGSHVDRSVKNPVGFVMDNIVGTVNLLEYARHELAATLKIFLNFSTDEVYGPAIEGIKFKEDDRHNPCNPYSASKSAAEHMCNSYFTTYGVPVITTHTMNVYGIRQSNEKFIPLIVDKMLKGEKIQIHTDEEGNVGSRKYLNAADVASAILFLLEKGTVGEKYNIASDEEISNLQLAATIAEIMGEALDYELKYPKETRGKNDTRYSISGQKLRALGWQQKIFLQDGLREVVKWHTAHAVPGGR
tara:strand:+ start:4434 stop:5438 length:1005 start_codon:yes stop_codon:yes gene_type:complete